MTPIERLAQIRAEEVETLLKKFFPQLLAVIAKEENPEDLAAISNGFQSKHLDLSEEIQMIYAAHFQEAEIQEIVDQYDSEVQKKMRSLANTLSDQIMALATPKFMAWLVAEMVAMFPDMEGIIDAEAAEVLRKQTKH